MKKLMITFLSALLVFGCSHGDPIVDKAVRLVKSNYRDCEKIIFVKVDTVTLGDNLKYRMEQNERNIKDDESWVSIYQDRIQEYRRYGSSAKRLIDGAIADLSKADSTLNMDRLRLAALDSLRLATLDIAERPTAYRVCVSYNQPTNFVWVQLAADGTFLKMSKDMNDLYLNPGEDMPGYFEIYERFSSLKK